MNARITPIRRVLCYAVPVTTFSILVNIPKFLETEVRTTYILDCIFYPLFHSFIHKSDAKKKITHKAMGGQIRGKNGQVEKSVANDSYP